MGLQAIGVSWSVDGIAILEGVDADVGDSRLVGLIGPNGSGKSSLLRCIARVQEPDRGSIELDGVNLRSLSTNKLARSIAFVHQENHTDVHLSALDVVLLGRTPFRRPLDRRSDADATIALESLHHLGALDLADRPWGALSGGERQRVLLAQALTQQPGLLLLDEPTNHLDLGHQLQILELVRSQRLTTLAALHDLNLAAMYCDDLVVLVDGRVFATGTPAAVLTPDLICEVYGVHCEVVRHRELGHPVVVPGRSIDG